MCICGSQLYQQCVIFSSVMLFLGAVNHFRPFCKVMAAWWMQVKVQELTCQHYKTGWIQPPGTEEWHCGRTRKDSPKARPSPRWSDIGFSALSLQQAPTFLGLRARLSWHAYQEDNCPTAGQSTRLLYSFFPHQRAWWELFKGKNIRLQKSLTKNIGCDSLCPSNDYSWR